MDFALEAEVDCEANADTWDLMFEVAGRSWSIWTNGGVHGTGHGAAFGPMSPAAASEAYSIADIPGWFADPRGGAFLEYPWYTYSVFGTHDISANYRVFAIDTGTSKYKLQVRSYYGASGASARLQLHYAEIGGAGGHDLEVNASAGGFGATPDNPDNKFVYVDLDQGEVLDIDDDAATTNLAWDIAFKRFNVICNGGVSGPGTVGTALAAELDGMYDADGLPIRAAFEAATEDDADALFDTVTSTAGLTFTQDLGVPFIINDGGDDSWFQFEFGPGGPTFFANPDVWWAVRGPQWQTFAKLHIIEATLASETRTFTAELHIQHAP